MCIEEPDDRSHRRRPRWKIVIQLVIFVTVLAFAAVVLKISPETVAAGAFVALVVGTAVKAVGPWRL
jgi:fatty acid desaturase